MSADVDGEILPDDWYLRICSLGARALSQGQALPAEFPRKLLEGYHNAPSKPPAYANSVATEANTCAAPPIPARTAPALPARRQAPLSSSSVLPAPSSRKVAPLPAGGGLPERPARPPSRSAALDPGPGASVLLHFLALSVLTCPFQRDPVEPQAPPTRVDAARQQAETLLGQVVTDERKREASQAWNRLGKEANRLATPERQQKVLFGIGKLGSAGARLLSDTRERVAKREL